MSYEVTEEELQKYVASHKEEIKEMIAERAEKVVKAEIRSAFRTGDSYYNREEGYARKAVREAVSKQIKETIKNMDLPAIDVMALREKLKKSADSQINKVKAHVSIDY